MALRKIIKIDEEKCNGCGLCIPNCPEGALKVIDGKVRLISDLFCDGLGACIGHCPEGAIEIEEREAEEYDERRVMENVVKQGENTIRAHLEHLEEHGEKDYLKEAVDYLNEKGIKIERREKKVEGDLPCGCPGSVVQDRRNEVVENKNNVDGDGSDVKMNSELKQWPVQLSLVSPNAPYFSDCDLLIVADCVPFADANFHSELLKGKAVVIGCPKLDNVEEYREKVTDILKFNNVKSVTVVIMEVPCCYGLYVMVEGAVKESGKDVKVEKVVVGVDGGRS